MMDYSEKKENWFVRILIIFFCLLVAVMIGFNYFCIPPMGEINGGIIILLAVLLIMVLSESFDNFSVGKLISITREAIKKEKDIQKLEKEKSDLLKQLITISSTQNQTQQHTNVFGDYLADKSAIVESASEREVKEKETDEQERGSEKLGPSFRVIWRKVESCAMKKYISRKGIHSSNVISEAKLVTQFYGIDPISNHQPIFDGYYKDNDNEVFVEFRPHRSSFFLQRERLYMMLSKLNHYKNVKGVKAHLDFVWMNVPEESSHVNSSDNLLKEFEPAIASGLLRISEIDITKEELEECKQKL